MISRENYEIWFVDYLDGALSATDQATLWEFLEQNTDLKEELEGMEDAAIRLSPPEIEFANKERLKKHIISVGTIDASNYETFFIRSIERDLTPNNEEELKRFLEANTALVNDYNLYCKTILPAEEMVFEHKEKLKKKPAKLVPLWANAKVLQWSAAAAIVFMVALFGWNASNQTLPSSDQVAENQSWEIKEEKKENEAIENQTEESTDSVLKADEAAKENQETQPQLKSIRKLPLVAPRQNNTDLKQTTTKNTRVLLASLELPQRQTNLQNALLERKLIQKNVVVVSTIKNSQPVQQESPFISVREFITQRLTRKVPFLKQEENIDVQLAVSKSREALESGDLPVTYKKETSGWQFTFAQLTITRN